MKIKMSSLKRRELSMNISERVKMREMRKTIDAAVNHWTVTHVVLAVHVVPPEVGAAVLSAVTLAVMLSCVFFVVHA